MLNAERTRDLGIRLWEADLFPCFSTGDLEGGFREGVCFAAGECGLAL